MDSNAVRKVEGANRRKYLLGIIVIVAGFLLLGSNIGLLPFEWKHIIFSWQMLLIVIGIISLSTSDNIFPGVILLLVGGLFLIPRIANLPFNTVHLFWPALLIAIGVLILVRRWPFRHHQEILPGPGDATMQDGYIRHESVFSSSKQRLVNQEFRGGRISCVFGGVDLDLTQATLASGIHELKIDVVFGGVNMIVPGDWNVQVRNSSVLGGFMDRRNIIKSNTDASRVLVIKASCVFGGGELKSF
ncbi:MAG TPA: DUF5668 domain-containing protein [Bacteroidales bacterium]|nr:DUF5668 domain-containing protein [Bacteroidales bacterium]